MAKGSTQYELGWSPSQLCHGLPLTLLKTIYTRKAYNVLAVLSKNIILSSCMHCASVLEQDVIVFCETGNTVLTITFSDVRTKCPDVLKMVRQSQNLVGHPAIVFSAYAWNGA